MPGAGDISAVANVEGWHTPAFARGVRDNVIGEVGLQVVRIGGLVVLARALTPSDFGLFRVLITFSAIIMMVNDLAAPDTLVQRPELTSAHESSAWWATISVSMLTCVALYLLAPLIAQAMAMPSIPNALRLLCIPILLEGSVSVPIARLTRRLQYRTLAIAEVAGELAFLGVAIALLVTGHPRMSLVGGLSARMAAHALLLWCAEPYIPRVKPTRKALMELRGFAGGAMGGQILHAISCNADYLLVGRFLGSSALGFYGMAWDLLRFVPDRLYKVAGRVTVPAFCRMQHEPEQLRRAYLSFLGYMSRLIVPPLACIAVAAPELLRQIYGPQWVAAALPLRILSIGIITIGLRAGMGAVYYALARPVFDMYLHGVRLALIVIAVMVTASSGLLWVCAGVSAVEAVCSVGGQLVACRMLGVSLGKASRVLIPGFTTAARCAAATVAGRVLAANLGVSGVLELLLMIALPAAAFLLIEARTVREMAGRRDRFGEHRRAAGKSQRRTGVAMARILIIAYTAYARDGRVKRQAEALTGRGDSVDAICLADGEVADTHGVNVIGILLPRYRGASKIDYLRSYLNFFSQAAALAIRRSLKERYDVVIACTMPDLAILSALPCRLFGSKLVLDVHDTMPELYLDKFGGRHGRFRRADADARRNG